MYFIWNPLAISRKSVTQYKSKGITWQELPLCAMGLVASWERWDAGSIPNLAQWVKDSCWQ